MIKRLLRVFLVLGILGTAYALPAPDPMTAKVSVANESSAELQKALPQAFTQVLMQVSGNPDISPSTPTSKKLDLSSMVQNYTFVRENDSQGQSALFAQITFDKNAIDDFLRESGQGIKNVSHTVVRLEILGINSLQDYLDAVHAIKNLPEIKKVSVNDADGSSLIVSVDMNGGAATVAQALSQNPNFTVNTEASSTLADLHYRWIRTS